MPPGKDGVVRHLFSGMNPQGTAVFGFKQPTPIEAAHDFLWRAHQRTPGKGEVVVFNRSHYEDVLVVRVHKLAPKSVWSKRYESINDFERTLAQNGTRDTQALPAHQPRGAAGPLQAAPGRPRAQLEDQRVGLLPSASCWGDYVEAYQDALEQTSTKHAPWYVIPANHKWFRNLAISRIIADTHGGHGPQAPADPGGPGRDPRQVPRGGAGAGASSAGRGPRRVQR